MVHGHVNIVSVYGICADNNTVLNFGELSGTVQSLLTTSATLCSIMLVEILVRVLAVGPKSFLFNIWNAFDAIVVLTSVTGEVRCRRC